MSDTASAIPGLLYLWCSPCAIRTPYASYILSCDVISRTFTPTGSLLTTCLIRTTFYPIPFLATLRDIYEKAVLGGRRDDEIDAMEFGAFAEMLHSRLRVRVDGAILFHLYPKFGLGSCPEGLLVRKDLEGLGSDSELSYLRMDCLRND